MEQRRVIEIPRPGKKPGKRSDKAEEPIPEVYPVIGGDLARDSMENDLPASDRQEL